MRNEGLLAQVGCKRRLDKYGSKLAIVAAYHLKQNFSIETADMVWVTDINHILTHEGQLYLAVAIDLYPGKIFGYLSAFVTQGPVGRRIDALAHANLAGIKRSANGRLASQAD